MRKSIADNIMETAKGLKEIGLMDEITMKNIETLCLPELPEFTPEKIKDVRTKYKLSQRAMSRVINVSESTVRQWEQGLKKPRRSSRTILNILDRKGLEIFL